MGLIKATTSSISQGLGDQFKEFIVCPEIEENVLIQKGYVKHGEGNKNPSEGIITKGSQIVVPAGMAMMIVDNGKVVEFCAEPGEYTDKQIYNTYLEYLREKNKFESHLLYNFAYLPHPHNKVLLYNIFYVIH